MKIDGSAVLHATPEKVWEAILDPAVLSGVIPGVQSLTTLGENHYALSVSLGVASIKGTYAGEVRLSDLVAPSSLTLHAAGAGAPGTIDTTVGVTLTDNGDGTTGLAYSADAMVGGMVGGVGQRVLTSVARKTAGQFFSAIDDVLTGKKVAKAVPVVAAATPDGGTPTAGPLTVAAPAVAAAVGPLGRIELLVAALFGAITMAIGVRIGARMARKSG